MQPKKFGSLASTGLVLFALYWMACGYFVIRYVIEGRDGPGYLFAQVLSLTSDPVLKLILGFMLLWLIPGMIVFVLVVVVAMFCLMLLLIIPSMLIMLSSISLGGTVLASALAILIGFAAFGSPHAKTALARIAIFAFIPILIPIALLLMALTFRVPDYVIENPAGEVIAKMFPFGR